MKKTVLMLFVLSAGIMSCGESKKSVEDIEKEYLSETPTNSEEYNDNKEQNESSEVAIENATSQYVYFEDFAAIDTKTKLYEAFPATYLEDGSQWFAEGTVEFQTTTLIDPNTSNAYFYMWDQSDNETLAFIEAPAIVWDEETESSRVQVIKSKGGVYTGMSLKELHEWNEGVDFSFSGFGWDYEGGIWADEGTKIGDSDVQFKLALEDYTDQNYTHLLGDMEFNTADEGILESPIIVDRLTIYSGNPEF